ncbi:15441_t:CDS:2, partial [Entrophospora sp. SA101]
EEHITTGSVIYQAIEDDPWVQKNELKNIIEQAVSFVNNNNTRGSSRHTTLLEILPEWGVVLGRAPMLGYFSIVQSLICVMATYG